MRKEVDFYKHWIDNPNYEYSMRNRDGSNIKCRAIYFPIRSNYKEDVVYDPCRVLIEIGVGDFREVPFVYVKRYNG